MESVLDYKVRFYEGLSGALIRRLYLLDKDNQRLQNENRNYKFMLAAVAIIVISRYIYLTDYPT